jgi:hypothetical protein
MPITPKREIEIENEARPPHSPGTLARQSRRMRRDDRLVASGKSGPEKRTPTHSFQDGALSRLLRRAKGATISPSRKIEVGGVSEAAEFKMDRDQQLDEFTGGQSVGH